MKILTYENIRFRIIIKDLFKHYDNKCIAQFTGYSRNYIYQLRKKWELSTGKRLDNKNLF